MKRSTLEVMTRLIVLISPLLGYMVIAIITGIIGFLCASGITILSGLSLTYIMQSKSVVFLLQILFVLAIARGILHYIEHACNHYIAFKMLALIRDKVFGKLRDLAPAKLEATNKGDLVSLITSDIELLEIFFAHTISPIFIAIGMTVIMLLGFSYFHFSFVLLAMLAYFLVGVLLPLIMSKKIAPIGQLHRQNFANTNVQILDSLRGIKEVIQYRYVSQKMDEMDVLNKEMDTINEQLKASLGTTQAITSFIISGFSCLTFLLGIALHIQGIISIEAVIITTTMMFSSFGSFVALANLGSGLSQTIASANRILDIFDEAPIVAEVLVGTTPKVENITLEDVDFSYDQEVILKDFSLSIKDHQINGIVGKSGTGKSTILKLMMRFFDVNKGTVAINNDNIKNIETKYLRNNIGYVTQTTHLFQDTIENNIRIAKLDASTQEIIEACKKASIHDFIMTLPNGYQSVVGELGDTLSGGQCQRISIARAFLQNASCLLLDEPTSNLDGLNEAIILKSLYHDKGRTVVLVSHRLSTLKIIENEIKLNELRAS